MTELTPGKRYRLTIEGRAIDRESIATEGGWCIITNREGTAELLPDPLPTTPGSVVLDCNGGGASWLLRNDNLWNDAAGYRLTAAELEGYGPFNVILDAGADLA